MKIVQIAIDSSDGHRPNIFGLGEDGKMYMWMPGGGWSEYK